MTDKSPFVVSFDWLAGRLGQPGISIVDASWYLPAQNRDPKTEFEQARIPGAVFFDQDAIVDQASSLPHTLPSASVFAQAVGALGISDADTIVIYDGPGTFTAPRVWWMFRLFGAGKVHVLDGGFDQWKAAGLPVETTSPASPAMAPFNTSRNDAAVAAFNSMTRIVAQGSCQIADARSSGRFTGEEPEPREGMRSGHMPGARNVPVMSLREDGKLKSLSVLREIFEVAGIDVSRPVVTTCGSGVTAAVITLALQSLGHADNRLYDGSWSEWGSRADTPVATGEA